MMGEENQRPGGGASSSWQESSSLPPRISTAPPALGRANALSRYWNAIVEKTHRRTVLQLPQGGGGEGETAGGIDDKRKGACTPRITRICHCYEIHRVYRLVVGLPHKDPSSESPQYLRHSNEKTSGHSQKGVNN